ncbi:MAG: DUF3114 domain-containing protein [Lactobacillus sp.]|jgi:hypothetical protein|nr:DUF3114 domain-containing protein [Lactobacillus sp.]MCI2032308.1 DUF3114 domain-containing protein [Lactobacillus sp.]
MRLNEQLTKLREFDQDTQNLYSTWDEAVNAIAQGVNYITKGKVNANGTFTPAKGTDREWLATLKDNEIKQLVGPLERPKGMTASQYRAYKKAVYKRASELQARGWNDNSIAAFGAYINAARKPLGAKQTVADYVKEETAGADKVGSGLFKAMWKADDLDQYDGNEKAAEAINKLQVLMRTAHMDAKHLTPKLKPGDKGYGELDGSIAQTKMLMSHFGDISPTSDFWNDLSQTVITALPSGLQGAVLNQPLAKEVNQYRYVISAQQMQYVRNYGEEHGAANDREALIKYLQSTKKYSLKESARLHQKNDTKHHPAPNAKKGQNLKIVQNFHTEFILSGNHMISEIDPEKESKQNTNGIVNGSSFNYAKDNDYQGGESDEWNALHSDHYKYDMAVDDLDPFFRKNTIDLSQYKAPKTAAYNSSQSTFAEGGLSAKEINKQTMKKFKEDLASD